MGKAKNKGNNKIGIEGIGRLEAEIMAAIWEFDKEVTVREVYEKMRKNKQIAYTTIMTVMNNLAEKKLLSQDKKATAYVYKSKKSKEDVAISLIKTVVDKILKGNHQSISSHFAGK